MKIRKCKLENRINDRGQHVLSIFIVLTIWSLFSNQLQAQYKGILFEKKATWKTILAKAKAENKYIFVDCYTTWCGPCARMNNTIFPLKKVGDFFNKKFISVKLQLDSTIADADDIKMLYPDAAIIKKEFRIRAYPTDLFFNPDGQIVNKVSAAPLKAEKFIQLGREALDPEKQFYTQVRNYDAGQRDAAFLKNLILLAITNSEYHNIPAYSKIYYATQPDLLNNDNLLIVYKSTTSVRDTGFNLIIANYNKFEKVVGKIKLHNFVTDLIMDDEFYSHPEINLRIWNAKQWDSCLNKLQQKYPLFALDAILLAKLGLYSLQGDWNNYAKAADTFIANKSCSPGAFDNFATTIYSNCDDKQLLARAAAWSRKSFIDQPKMEFYYIENYAALLNKLGESKKALQWALKAQKIAIQEGAEKTWGQDLINSIKKGKKYLDHS